MRSWLALPLWRTDDLPARESVREKRYLHCFRMSMDNQTPPRDDDPSDMTDFEKNATSEELQQLAEDRTAPDPNRIRPERGDEGPGTQKTGSPAVARR